MRLAAEPVRSDLAAVASDLKIVSDPAVCSNFGIDSMLPQQVVYPQSGQQVADILKFASDHDLAVIPCRSGTKLGIGNPPRRYDVALSLKDMNRVWEYEPADLTVSVEPGMKLGDFQHFLGRHNLWFPLDPAGGAKASLGGVLAANSAGPLRLRYGGPRDMVLGMTIATGEGKLVKTGGRVVKNVAGYDLGKLLIGSYGTLGIIVGINLKLFPRVPERATFVFGPKTFDLARELRRRMLNSPLRPLRMVLLDEQAAAMVVAGAEGREGPRELELWIEAGGPAPVLRRYAETFSEWGRAAGISSLRLNDVIAERAWACISDLSAWLGQTHSNLAILKAALPIAAAEDFAGGAREEAEQENLRLASFSQIGVGVTELAVIDMTSVRALPGFIGRVRDAAENLGGSLVVERCPPEIKHEVDVWGDTSDDFEVMRKVKAEWDPKGILSPGRFVGGL